MISATNSRPPARPTMTTAMTWVTPEKAGDWLEKNNNGNRDLKKGEVELLRRQIEENRYEPTHQGIGFYEDGTLADGQHRLHAIVASGVGIWINVTTGMKRSAVHKIDRGIGRTSLDSLHFLGVKSDNRRVAVCLCMINQFEAEKFGRERWSTRKRTSEEFSDYYARFLDAIEFSVGFAAAAKSPAPLKAAVATAWYGEDRERLTEFMQVMDTGEIAGEGDKAAIRLRDYIREKKYGQGTGERNDLFYRCCGAIRYFIARKGLSRLYATPEHAFKFASFVGEAS